MKWQKSDSMHQIVLFIISFESSQIRTNPLQQWYQGWTGGPWAATVGGSSGFLPKHPRVMREEGDFKKLKYYMSGISKDGGSDRLSKWTLPLHSLLVNMFASVESIEVICSILHQVIWGGCGRVVSSATWHVSCATTWRWYHRWMITIFYLCFSIFEEHRGWLGPLPVPRCAWDVDASISWCAWCQTDCRHAGDGIYQLGSSKQCLSPQTDVDWCKYQDVRPCLRVTCPGGAKSYLQNQLVIFWHDDFIISVMDGLWIRVMCWRGTQVVRSVQQ